MRRIMIPKEEISYGIIGLCVSCEMIGLGQKWKEMDMAKNKRQRRNGT